MVKTIFFIGLIAFLAIAIFSDASYSQDGTRWVEYSTKGNPKTTGHDFTIKHPPSYEKATEFKKDEYIQVFNINDEEGSGDTYYYLAIGINNLPDNITPSTLRTEGVWNLLNLNSFWDIVAKQIKGVRTKAQAIDWENLPMAKFTAVEILEGTTDLSTILFALHGDKLIKLECGMITFEEVPEFADTYFAQDSPCSAYFNSLAFLDSLPQQTEVAK
jgi:hypothetical protein